MHYKVKTINKAWKYYKYWKAHKERLQWLPTQEHIGLYYTCYIFGSYLKFGVATSSLCYLILHHSSTVNTRLWRLHKHHPLRTLVHSLPARVHFDQTKKCNFTAASLTKKIYQHRGMPKDLIKPQMWWARMTLNQTLKRWILQSHKRYEHLQVLNTRRFSHYDMDTYHIAPVRTGIKSDKPFPPFVCQANVPPSYKHSINDLPTLLLQNRTALPLFPHDDLSSFSHLWYNYKHPASHLSPTIKQHPTQARGWVEREETNASGMK